jgi:hypothetical protein
MSKIPQGEWNAIATRHARGESLSAIARSYGCTPPAIHYVLKRNGQQPVEKPVPPVSVAPGSDEPHRETPRLTVRPHSEIKPPPINRLNEAANSGTGEPAAPANELVGSKPTPLTNGSARSEPVPPVNGFVRSEPIPPANELARSKPVPPANGSVQPAADPHRLPGSSPAIGRTLASANGLDSELHERAEVAIEAFRACFDAALAGGSSNEHARLRQAASDLMRVAARTTIVLDRLNALSERAAGRFDPRSNGSRPS